MGPQSDVAVAAYAIRHMGVSNLSLLLHVDQKGAIGHEGCVDGWLSWSASRISPQ